MTSKFEECFIHIGTPKTGTTTLQKFFFKNKKILEKNNFFYPETFGKENHTKLYLAVADYKSKTHMHMQAGITNEKLQGDYSNNIKNLFQKEIENTNSSKLLISSEGLSRHLEGDEINSLKKFLESFVDKIKIIVYLRPQHEFSISRLPTNLLFGQKNLNVLGKPTENPIYDYDKLLSSWEKVFGKENLIPKIFSKKEFQDEDIKKDFLTILGLNFSQFNDVRNLNESLNVDALRFMVGINHYLPWQKDDKVNPYRGDIFDLVSRDRNGKGLLPTHKRATEFFQYFSKSNEKVRDKWFPGKKELFEVDFTKYPEQVEEYPEIDHSAFKIFADLWSKKQKLLLANDKIVRGQMNIINGQYEEAISQLKQALKIIPNHLFALQSICNTLIKLKRNDEADEYIDKAIIFYPNKDVFKRLEKKIIGEKNTTSRIKVSPKLDPQRKRHGLVGALEKWKSVRDLHIKFLKEVGLESKNYFLDVGCGTLRGGIPIIDFLEQGHYYGIDVRSDALEEARKELLEEKLAHKEPALILSKDFSSLTLERKFDYVWAYAVLIHLTDEKLDSCFEFVNRHLADKGTFYATVNIGDKIEGKWEEFPVMWRSLEFYKEKASSYGLKVQDMGNFGPLSNNNNRAGKDGRRMLKMSRK